MIQKLALASATSQPVCQKIFPIEYYGYDFLTDRLSVAFAKLQPLNHNVYNPLFKSS